MSWDGKDGPPPPPPPSPAPDYSVSDQPVLDEGEPTPDLSNQPDRLQPAAIRPEWQQPLALGQVDRVGNGVVDERARQFLPAERRIAEHLAGTDGAAVVALPEDSSILGRKADALVDDRVTEFKSLAPGATDGTVNHKLLDARGQAPNVVIDARGSGLDEATAQRGIARFDGSPWSGDGFDSIMVMGDDYVISRERKGGNGERGR